MLLATCYLTPNCCLRIYSLGQSKPVLGGPGQPALIMTSIMWLCCKKVQFKLKRIVMQICALLRCLDHCSQRSITQKYKLNRYSETSVKHAECIKQPGMWCLEWALAALSITDTSDWHLIWDTTYGCENFAFNWRSKNKKRRTTHTNIFAFIQFNCRACFFLQFQKYSHFLHVHRSHKMLMHLAAKSGIDKHNR